MYKNIDWNYWHKVLEESLDSVDWDNVTEVNERLGVTAYQDQAEEDMISTEHDFYEVTKRFLNSFIEAIEERDHEITKEGEPLTNHENSNDYIWKEDGEHYVAYTSLFKATDCVADEPRIYATYYDGFFDIKFVYSEQIL